MMNVSSTYKKNDSLSFIEPGKIQYQLLSGTSKSKIVYDRIVKELLSLMVV